MVKNNNTSSGISLIEALVALTLLSIALLSIQVAILKSTETSREVNKKIKTEKKANNKREDYWANNVGEQPIDAEVSEKNTHFKQIKITNTADHQSQSEATAKIVGPNLPDTTNNGQN